MANTPSISIGVSGKCSEEWCVISDATPSAFQKVIAEFMGTYILIFAGCGASLVDERKSLTIVGIAMVWGLASMVLIHTLGHISDAHFNPAITISFAAARRFPRKHVPMYVLSQMVGSTPASFTLRVLFNDKDDDIHATMTQYSSSTTDLQAVIWEFMISFILMFTTCSAATDHRANKDFSGVAIGAAVWFNVMIAGPITGASMNPARSVGPAVVTGVYKNLWVFIVAPILGAVAATMVYCVLRIHKPEKPESIKFIYNDTYSHSDP